MLGSSTQQTSIESHFREAGRCTENTEVAPTGWREPRTVPTAQAFWPSARQWAGTVLRVRSGCAGYSNGSIALVIYRAPHEEGGQPHLNYRLQSHPGKEGTVI